MAGGGGGAWKVAYADFVTAMMAFFMVMWLTSQKPEVKEAVAEYFRNPSGRRITGNPNSSLLPSHNESSGGKRNRARGKEASHSQSKMTDEGKNTNVGTLVQFHANSVELSPEAKTKIDEMLHELKGKPHRIEVRGHALADRQSATELSLDALQISYQRSLATMAYLVSQGIEANRIRLSQAGASEPRFAGEEIDNSANARVEIYLLNEAYEPPHEMIQRLVSTKSQAAEADAKGIEEAADPSDAQPSGDKHAKKGTH